MRKVNVPIYAIQTQVSATDLIIETVKSCKLLLCK